MNRNSLLEMSGRVMHLVQRFTLNQSNDNPMMQLLHLDGMNTEFRGAVERIQHFGFTSTPLPRDQQQQGQQAQSATGATGGDGEPLKGPAAEGICLYVGGQRNHPVCIAIDDRRHRPMGLKPGENAQYDDLGQMTLLRRTGLFLLSSDDVQPQQSGSGGTASSGGSQQVARMASLRHVQKQKQPRPGGTQSGSAGSGAVVSAIARAAGATTQQGQQNQNFQHEGQTVNTEVRVTKTDIQILDGETVVGRYDKASGTWTFTSQNITLTASSHLTLECTGGPTDIKGKPINFNGGGPSSPPFSVP